MSHLLAGVPKDMLGGIVLLAIHLEPLLLAELSQQSVIPACTRDLIDHTEPAY